MASAWPCLLAALLLVAPSRAAGIDVAQSRIGFTLKTRWGQTLEGRFPSYRGEILALPDGRLQVRLSLSAADVEIVGNRNYTRLTRGRGFFEAERYPELTFVSEPYDASLVYAGGPLAGLLTVRDVQRRETFVVEPTTCARPGRDCDVVASGVVQREDYGIDRWSFAVGNEVRFVLRIRARGDGT